MRCTLITDFAVQISGLYLKPFRNESVEKTWTQLVNHSMNDNGVWRAAPANDDAGSAMRHCKIKCAILLLTSVERQMCKLEGSYA